MKKQDRLLVLLMVLIMFGLGYNQLTVSDSSNIQHYSGDFCDSAIYWWDDSMTSSDTMTVEDYEFAITMYDQYMRFYGCRENTCNGEVSYVDNFNCNIWVGSCPTYRPYWYCTGGTCHCNNPSQWMSGSGHKCYEKGSGSWSDTQYEQTGTQSCSCGGANAGCTDDQGNVNWGASYKVDIYKNGVLMDTVGDVLDNSCSNQRGSASWEDDFINAYFGNQIYYGTVVSREFECMFSYYNIKSITTTSIPTTTTTTQPIECSSASDCSGPHIQCQGHWECQYSECVWICDDGEEFPVTALILLAGLGFIIIYGKKWLK